MRSDRSAEADSQCGIFMGTFTINIQCGPEGDEEKEPIIYAR